MDSSCTYQILVRNGLDEAAFNLASPTQISAARLEGGATRLTVQADQSGLIGLLRHLHQQGYLLLAVWREGPKANGEKSV